MPSRLLQKHKQKLAGEESFALVVLIRFRLVVFFKGKEGLSEFLRSVICLVEEEENDRTHVYIHSGYTLQATAKAQTTTTTSKNKWCVDQSTTTILVSICRFSGCL